jgi:spermidine synthase
MDASFEAVAMRRVKRPAAGVRGSVALLGFSAVTGQIVLMRELMVVFNGNEMSLGIMLATWLFWTAVGSSLSGRFSWGRGNARYAVAAMEVLLAVSLPATIWMLRASKALFQAVPGELVGPAPMMQASLVCLSLFCAIAGALFVASARMVQQQCGVSARDAASSAYMLEAIGSSLGGVLASLLMLRFLGAFQIAAVVAVANMSMAAVVLSKMSRRRLGVIAALAVLCGVPLLFSVAPWLERTSQAMLWRGFRVAASRDSIYGNLTVTETDKTRSLYANGILLANAPDPSAAEEPVHYALLEHRFPRDVLLIGGAASGSIAEAMKHPTVARIDYVELDPAVIEMTRQFFPGQFAPLLNDPRVHLHLADGRRFLAGSPDAYDVIVVNVPDPQTAQLNRFFTAEFFRSARQHLAPGGLLAFQLRSSEEAVSPELAEFLRCIRRTLAEEFTYIVAIPGDSLHFFAANEPNVLTDDPQTLIARMRARNLKTQYVREYFIPFRMMPDRMEEAREQLEPLAATPVNRDFAPVAYYFNIVFAGTQFKGGFARWFQAAAHIRFIWIACGTLIAMLAAALPTARSRNRERVARGATAGCVAATGFTLITLQVLLLLAFESIYGYVYHQLAILVGMGMAGIAFGSWLGLRQMRTGKYAPVGRLAATQLLLALSCPVLVLAFRLLAQGSGTATTWLAAQCAFPALSALCGVLGGYQFSAAMEVYIDGGDNMRKVGVLYALDLLGGCVGALVVSTYLIPVFGFWQTAGLCAAVNIAPALLAARLRLR